MAADLSRRNSRTWPRCEWKPDRPRSSDGVQKRWTASRFNRRHKLFGHLFSSRYKALIVDGSGDGYLRTVCDYVHLNPVRASILAPGQPLRAYPWSSYPEAKAERLVAQELARRGWDEGELERQRKADREKVKMARRLRAETTMTWAWIAGRLKMGTSVAACLRQR